MVGKYNFLFVFLRVRKLTSVFRFCVVLIFVILIILELNDVLKITNMKSENYHVIPDDGRANKWFLLWYKTYGTDREHNNNGNTVKATTTDIGNKVNRTTEIKEIEGSGRDKTLPLCPEKPPRIYERFFVNKTSPSFEELEKEFHTLQIGGRYKPPDCIARHRVAIIVPYRNREQNLKTFLKNLHPFLQRQQLDYGIYIIDQANGSKFNRGLLLNIGYTEALKLYDYQCFVFHDVDKIPMDLRNIYSCPTQPRHLSAGIDYFKFKLPYQNFVGGVVVLTKDQYEKVNGFSNMYFGWGGEDDDFYRRIKSKGYAVTRYAIHISRYASSHHVPDKGNEPSNNKFRLLGTKAEGLNSLKYKLLQIDYNKLYTRIYVQINEQEVKSLMGK